MKKASKVLSLALVSSFALSSFAFASMPDETIIFGDKAYNKNLLNNEEYASQINKDFKKNDNTFILKLNGKYYGTELEEKSAEDIPALVYIDENGKETEYEANDGDKVEATLKVESVSAITDKTVQVKFSKAVDPTKVLTSNFTVLNKNSAPSGRVTKALVSADKKVVTLTINESLVATDAPHTLFINKNAIPVENNSIEISMPEVVPAIKGYTVTDNNTVVVETDVDLKNKDAAAALVTSVVDLTDSTNTDTVSETTVVSSGKLTIDMASTGFFKAGHNYKATIATNTLEDAFGNKNTEPVEYTFSIETNEQKPAMTSVEFFQDKTTAGQIDALATFDIPVANVAEKVNVNLIDKIGFTTTAREGLTAKFYRTEVATHKEGLELEKNQVLILDVNDKSGTPINMLDSQNYTLELAAGEVKDTTLAAVQNEVTSAEATGVDVTAPTVVLANSQLNSSKEIKIAFSEAVTYDASKTVTVEGFDATGMARDIQATVTILDGGKAALLTPKTEGEIFQTAASAETKYAVGTFVDVAGNKIAVNTGTALTGATDKAAPAVVAIADGTDNNTLTIKFTESVAVGDSADPAKITVNGAVFEYEASPATDKWSISTDTITVTKTGEFAVGDSVSVPVGAVIDETGNLATSIFGITK